MTTSFDLAQAIFEQADANKDGALDETEFRNWLSGGQGLSSLSAQQTTAEFTTSEYQVASQSAFESTAETTSISYGTTTVQNNIFNDPNPKLVRRAAPGGPVTYQQNISVRYLQPPPPPPPGPLIIKEVRPSQPPPPPPLVVRQCAKPIPPLPPLILRERPPVAPPRIPSHTVIRRLPMIPVPPRSVIIERIPPNPPKPRDIVIERWIPYAPQPKRQTILQRAPPPIQYPVPRNVIIVYDAVQARVIRQFQKFNIVQENPEAYRAHYGASLLDSATLVQQARNAGIIEDISPPQATTILQYDANNSIGTDEMNYGFTVRSPTTVINTADELHQGNI